MKKAEEERDRSEKKENVKVHYSWANFIKDCRKTGSGRFNLKIQNGVPVAGEQVSRKVRFKREQQ